MNSRILIIVPAFNESEAIQKTIAEILKSPVPITTLVVNDGSRDDTAQLAQAAGAHVISLPYNLGIGGAVQTGFKFAYENQFSIAVQVDGDGQHNVEYLKELIQPILDGKADMVIGSRFLEKKSTFRSSRSRRIGIKFFSYLISFLTGTKVTDPTSGFRAYNEKMIAVFAQYYPHDFPEPEAIVIANRFRAAIKEIPVEMRKRFYGTSSIGSLKSFYYMIKVTMAILLDKFKTKVSLE